ncbi:MAG: hypothetical protein WHW07_02500 [Bacteroidales bacterium]|jgi:hypothetical protein
MIKLDDIPKKDVFKVPENYFNSFEDELKTKLQKTKSSKTRVYDIVLPYIYMAASIIVLVIAVKTVLNIFVVKKEIKEQTSEIIEYSYAEIYYDDIYNDQLLIMDYMENYYNENQISDENNLTAIDLEDYLVNYYIEYELLNE